LNRAAPNSTIRSAIQNSLGIAPDLSTETLGTRLSSTLTAYAMNIPLFKKALVLSGRFVRSSQQQFLNLTFCTRL